MRRNSFLILISLVVLIGMLAIGRSPGLRAHEGTPEAMGGHPFVGTWHLVPDDQQPGDAPELVSASWDGTYIQNGPEGEIGFGSWEPTGESTVTLSIWFPAFDEEGAAVGLVVVRADVVVAVDAQSWTGTYTLEFVDATGIGMGEFGPGTATATRLAVEPVGTPQGTFEELFSEATPEA